MAKYPVPPGSTEVDIPDPIVTQGAPIFTVPPPPDENDPPIVNAGDDIAMTLPTNTVILRGIATDPDNDALSYFWKQTSGKPVTIVSPNSIQTQVNGFVEGNYTFNLAVSDGKDTTSDDVNVSVKAAPVPPDNGIPPGYVQTYKTGYDKQADLDPDGHGQIGNGGLSTSIFRTGPGSFLSRPDNVSNGYRSEVQYDDTRTPVEGIFDYYMMFPAYKQTGYGGSAIQWHGNNNNSANVFLYVSEGKFSVWRNPDGGSNRTQAGTLTPQSNKWYHMRWYIKWSTGNDGYVRFYIDDMNTPYFTFTGKTQDNNGKPYLKIGQNNWNNSKGQDMYFDDLTIYSK